MKRFNPVGEFVLGMRWEFDLTITDSEGQPKDLSGATVTVVIGTSNPLTVEKKTDTTRYLSRAATLASQTDERGRATAVFLPEETALLRMPMGGLMYYQVTVFFDADNRDAPVDGYFKVQHRY